MGISVETSPDLKLSLEVKMWNDYLNIFLGEIIMWEKQKLFMAQYLCEGFVEAVERYENLVQLSTKENFQNKDLGPYRGSMENLKFKHFAELNAGHNRLVFIQLFVFRVIIYRNYTFILASEFIPVHDTNKYFCMIVASPENSDATTEKWKKQIALNMSLVVKEPSLETELSNQMQICFARLENVVPKQGKTWKEKVQEIKEKGNQAYKEKNFMNALIYYQYGLACCQDFKESRTRAILYSNSSACLYEMRLYDTSIKYATMAIKIDSNYQKGYIRKILSLMEKKQFSQIPNLLVSLQTKIDAESISKYNKKYTVYLCNSIGMYNWKDIFQQTRKQAYFCQFFSKKISTRLSENRYVYYANTAIKKYQLLILNKPIIHYSNSKQTKEINPHHEIQQYTALQKTFYNAIKSLPCQCHPSGGIDSNHGHSIDKQELKRKLQRCLSYEKDLEKPCVQKIGVWAEMFNFTHQCQPNCSSAHIRSVMCFSAVKPIPKGQLLTLNYVSGIQKGNKSQFMEKYGISCKCRICQWKQWPKDITNTQVVLKTINSLQNSRMSKELSWAHISSQNSIFERKRDYTIFNEILENYIEMVDKETHWEDIVNLLKLLRNQKNEQYMVMQRAMIGKGLSQFLKVPVEEVRQLIEIII